MDEEPSLDLELQKIMNMVPSSGDMEEELQLGDQTMIDDHDQFLSLPNINFKN